MGQEPTPMTTTSHHDLTPEEVAARRQREAARQDDPEAIRRDIADTRSDMEGTLAAINDRVNPQRVYERRTGRVRRRWRSVKRSVMGSEGTSNRSLSDRTPDVDVGGRAQQAKEAITSAPDAAERRTRGNPLAAGLIAFGLGALIGGALPETEAERRAAREADRRLDLDSTRQRLSERAQQVGEDVQGSARDAAEDLKDSAARRARDATNDAQQEARRVKQDAQDSAEQVRRQQS